MESSKRFKYIGVGVVVLLVLLLVSWAGINNGLRSTIGRSHLVGDVTAVPAAKFGPGIVGSPSAGANFTKFAVNLRLDDGTETIINCSSTQCAVLQPGQRVELSCYNERHWWEPNEVECRYSKLLPRTAVPSAPMPTRPPVITVISD